MARQYKLRLSEGTLLGVDLDGLRAWLHDSGARVQRVGSVRWLPLSEMIAIETAAAAVESLAKPVQSVAAPVESVATPEETIPPANVPMLPPEALEEPEPEGLADVARAAVTTGFVGFVPPRPVAPREEPPVVSYAPAVPSEDLSPVPYEPPVSTRDLPIIRLKPLDPKEEESRLEELDLYEEPEPTDLAPPPPIPVLAQLPPIPPIAKKALDQAAHWVARVPEFKTPALPKRKILMGTAAVAGVAALASGVVWMSSLGLFAPKAPPAPAAPVSPPVAQATPPPLPPELQAAAEQLPHLAPDTIQLLASTGPAGAPDPPDLFRRAQLAASRGLSALSPEEAEELRSLRRAVVGALRSSDRTRVLAYERITAGRDLMAGEDARVARLYARGVRALAEPRRERLQELLGKAIAASLAPNARRADAR